MREIKFRAWDGETMVYFDLDDQVQAMGRSITQYTGLKDKNGKDVFEGDIVHIRTTADGYTERWDIDHAYTVIYDEEKAKYRLEGQYDCWGMIWKMEIIGNVYESPELIKTT